MQGIIIVLCAFKASRVSQALLKHINIGTLLLICTFGAEKFPGSRCPLQ